ncbi:MAG: bifunctional phosphoribosylaminoimidazolecarboxamide formyltransferase/IMP cyclohydrolase [Anaerolineae bacterium]|nr:bifunctional phosphoribosylaminoimidazolecarboxamide formyltransferase/IMP cyclohydrolase [Anaerolineae bacterium]
MPRALFSAHDKTGLAEFARQLISLGWDIVASGGTQRALSDAGLPVTPIEQITGFDELLGGRVKTLHPAIHAGILARDREEDLQELRDKGYAPISLVVCNLYPFQQTIARASITLQEAVEQIDIGGVTLIRSGAKNFMRTIVICDPKDYQSVTDELVEFGTTSLALRRELAVKAFAHARDYDTAIHAFLAQDTGMPVTATELPQQLSLGMKLLETLRYGENPHQMAAYYSRKPANGPLGGTVLGGKQLSYNNIMDLDAAWRAACSFVQPVVVIVKHMNPCGISTGPSLADAFPAALESDPVSAFGGVIAVNRPVTEDFVTALGGLFIEAIAAPRFDETAINLLASSRKSCRLVQIPSVYDGTEWEIRSVHRGFLIQQPDMGDPEHTQFQTVTRRQPTSAEVEMLRFAWKAVQHVKSNAIVFAQEQKTIGIGGGLPSRVDAVKVAIEKAGERAKGAVMSSDAFFPFPDGVEVAAAAGITAVIQPGGSIRDAEVIRAADEAGLAMVFTGARHFRH